MVSDSCPNAMGASVDRRPNTTVRRDGNSRSADRHAVRQFRTSYGMVHLSEPQSNRGSATQNMLNGHNGVSASVSAHKQTINLAEGRGDSRSPGNPHNGMGEEVGDGV